jgi:hypothetical protein
MKKNFFSLLFLRFNQNVYFFFIIKNLKTFKKIFFFFLEELLIKIFI